jgi:adenylate cyclase
VKDDLVAEGAAPIRIGLSLHLGTVVLGEIGAAGQAPRTLAGDTVNTASRLEAETKRLEVEALISEPLVEAAGVDVADLDFESLVLRGVSEPLRALPMRRLTDIGFPDMLPGTKAG